MVLADMNSHSEFLDHKDFILSIIWLISSIFLHVSSHSPFNSVQQILPHIFLTKIVSVYFTWELTDFTS